MTLVLTACGTENFLSEISPTIGTDTTTDISNTDDTSSSAAIISGTDTGSVIEDVDPDNDNLLEVAGQLNIIDNDTNEDGFINTTVFGNFGSLYIDINGNWNYGAANDQSSIQNLNNNDTLTDTLTISSIDGTTHNIQITIIGVTDSGSSSNTAAIITGTDSGNVTEDVDPNNNGLLEIGGALTITDIDAGEAFFIATTYNGNYGNLTIDAAGNWSYAADNNQANIQNLVTGASLSDSLIISSIDGTTHTITITINGTDEANSPAIITGTDSGNVTEDVDPNNNGLLEVGGTLTITDTDVGEDFFIATTYNGNYGNLTIDAAGNWSYAANNNQANIQNLDDGMSLNDGVTVSSIDGTTHIVVITLFGADEINTTASITLSWIAPSEREDNTALSLSEIAGYNIFYGTSQGQYTNSVNIDDSSATGYTFSNFPTGSYYFVITTIDTDGHESQYSPSVNINI